MGLTWKNHCFCGNFPHYGTANNANQADCPGGECPATDCDSTGTVADAPVGVADLCSNGDRMTCDNRNAVYSLKGVPPTNAIVGTLARLEMQLELADQRSLDLRMVRVEACETFGGGGTGLGAGLSLQGESTCRAEHVEFVGNTQRGFGARLLSPLSPMLGLLPCLSLTALHVCGCNNMQVQGLPS